MWKFLSRGHGETEGYSHGSLAEFKGNPLRALAREICQNSLDAADGSGKPVVVEFESNRVAIDSFPGMESMREVIAACTRFWKGKGDINTITFLNKASDCLKKNNGQFTVLRISDYNTTGVCGAFSEEDITPWGSLVKGNSFSVKADERNAAGSYGIGKAAPFVSSYFQTVFYRTLDKEGVRASLGVARLMAHESVSPVAASEDPVRRSVGYYGADVLGRPTNSFPELDAMNIRSECGTDLFIPGFTENSTDEAWIREIFKEIVDNFLYSIYSGKLEVKAGKRSLTRQNLSNMLEYVGSKDAKIFFRVLQNSPDVIEITRPFYGLGSLRLRLLFDGELNKKILVVRNSGMKIAKINSLPRMISYAGFLELQGDALNQFFRAMENPSHNAWEPKRHGNPSKAKQYKDDLESWVIERISEKLIEISGEESIIHIGDCFNFSGTEGATSDARQVEKITDAIDTVDTEIYAPQLPHGGKISIRDEGNIRNSQKTKGEVNPDGQRIGHRHRTGQNSGGQPTGRNVTINPDGLDTVNVGDGGNPREVLISARIISHGNGVNKLIFTAEEEISLGRIEIVTRGENGRTMQLRVQSVDGISACIEDGHIAIRNVPAHTKQTVEIELVDKHSYAMGVKAYGN